MFPRRGNTVVVSDSDDSDRDTVIVSDSDSDTIIISDSEDDDVIVISDDEADDEEVEALPGAPPSLSGARGHARAERIRKEREARVMFGAHRPGQRGFNSVVARIMRKKGKYIGGGLQTTCTAKADGSGFAHQETAAWLAGPETPIDRLLVVHRTGSGKTNVMIKIADAYFFDPRPKVVIFPNNSLVDNFYQKFYREHTRYNAFAEAVAARDRKANTFSRFKEVMEMNGRLSRMGQAGELAAPIRSIRYTIAGGATVTGAGGPSLPIFKIGYKRGANPFDNKVIIMDEIHNLVRPPIGVDASVIKKLAKLRKLLYEARGSVIVGLTATPLVREVADGKELIRVIKGAENAGTPTDEGFISYFNALPTEVYPSTLPVPQAVVLFTVPLKGDNLTKYARKAQEMLPLSSDPARAAVTLFSLMNYCNTSAFYVNANRAPYAQEVRKAPEQYATKLAYIAKEVIDYKHKCAVIIHRKLGFVALKNIILSMDPEKGRRFAFMAKPKSLTEQESNPTLAKFNDIKTNGVGQEIRCLVLDAESYGEGVDLIGVRRFIMANPAPNYAAYKQWTGRVYRSCGYDYLPRNQRNVVVEMVVARNPSGAPTADEYQLELLRKETQEMEKAMKTMFALPAADRDALGHP
jgi:hypothetical protein